MNSPKDVQIVIRGRKSLSPRIKRLLKKAVQTTLEHIPISLFRKLTKNRLQGIITVAILGPKAIQSLNSKYRNKTKPTDVLSFSRIEHLSVVFPEDHELGDVLICWSIAKKQSREYGTSLEEELNRLTVHGVLHLFGYDHEINKAEEKRMFVLQEKILKHL